MEYFIERKLALVVSNLTLLKLSCLLRRGECFLKRGHGKTFEYVDFDVLEKWACIDNAAWIRSNSKQLNLKVIVTASVSVLITEWIFHTKFEINGIFIEVNILNNS